MKRSKIALITSGCLAIAPVITLATGIVSSCGKKVAPDDDGIYVSTKDVEVNHNSGVGNFDIMLDEQPVDNVAYVYIITAEGPHHVELLDDENSIYDGHPASLYAVKNGIAHVHMGFTEFIGETTKTVVSIEVRYNNRKGEWVLKHVNGINLTVTYVHNETEEVHIFSLNDLHGVAEGYGESLTDYPAINVKDPGVIRIMDKISPIIDSHPGSFLVTAGDNNSGDMFSTAVHGQSIYHMLQTMGARYSAVGNHAFEWGIRPMSTFQFDTWARTPETMNNYFLASNILNGQDLTDYEWETNPHNEKFKEDYICWRTSRVTWADPYKIVNMNGHLVCLIGLTTSATLSDGNQDVVNNLSFIDYNAAFDYSIYECQQEVDEKLFNSIETFIPLTHIECGANEDGSKPTGPAADFAKKIKQKKVDAVITGHSHSFVNGTVYNPNISKNILIGQAETEGRKYLDITLHFKNTNPIGQKLVNIQQSVNGLGMENFETWQEANDNLTYIKSHPSTPTSAFVVSEFNTTSQNVLTALDTTIAQRHDTLLYPGVDYAEGGIGHGYYINQYKSSTDPEGDGGYIFDQLGAWVGYASLAGFASLFKEQIEKSVRGLTYPAVSLINQDSMKVSYTTKEDDVKLKDMYNIQTYENTTKFGYLSIWQLANIINHSLAGDNGKFNYYDLKAGGNYYVPPSAVTPAPEDYPTPTAETSLNNMSRFYYVNNRDANPDSYISTCVPNEFGDFGEHKKLSHVFCVYACGPVQMYGVRVGLEEATDAEKTEAGRTWKVALVATESQKLKDEGITAVPDLHIIDPTDDPTTPEEIDDEIYSTIREPNKWKSAEQWLLEYGGMVPIITNNFLYDGANWETPMAKVYMDHNAAEDSKNYPVMNFSQITRELLIEFCSKTDQSSNSYKFDMTKDILNQLIEYPWE